MDAARLDEAEVRLPDGRAILGPLTLRIGEGEHWAVLGPNGSGKTTLLTLLGAYRQPSRGFVEVLGARLGRTDVRILRQRIGHVSHAIADMMRPGIDVETVVLTGKQATIEGWFQTFDDGDLARARDLLERFGCGGSQRRRSGGAARASVSACCSLGRSSGGRGCCSWTSRPRGWTCRGARR